MILPPMQIPNQELEKSTKAVSKKLLKGEKPTKVSSNSDAPFGFLKELNAWLSEVPGRINTAYENYMNNEAMTQEKADVICEWLAWKVNIAVERKRQAAISALSGQFNDTVGGKVMKAATVIQSFLSDPLGTLGSFASLIFGPVPTVFKWFADLGKEVTKLGSNLAKIAGALPPPVPPSTPNINYNKFKLKINPITIGEIVAGPAALPAPEVMFPEPEKPFSKETFTKGFEKASAKLKSAKQKYVLKEEDKKTLAEFDNKVDSNFSIA